MSDDIRVCRERLAENMFDKGKARLAEVVHEEVHLLDRIGQVRTCVTYCSASARLWYLDG